MTQNIGAIGPGVKLGGTDLEKRWLAQLIQLRIDRGVCIVGRATLRFKDNGYSLSASETFALGKEVEIKEPDKGVLFHGFVTGINLEQSASSVPEFVVVVDDAAYKLSRGTQTATYQNISYTEAIQKTASKHSLRPEVTASSLVLDYFLQAGSDLDFVDMLCRRLGYAWYVDDGPKLVAKPLETSGPVATLTMKEDLEEFSVRATGLRPTKLTMNGWDPNTQQGLSVVQTPTPDGTPPALIAPYSGSGPTKISAAAMTVSELTPTSAAEAKLLASSVYNDWAASAIVARGTADVNSAVKPGVTIRIAEAGPASGSYLVTSVEHLYDRSGFVTKFVCGPRRPAGLVDTLGPPPVDAGFKVNGLVVGVVTNVDDTENAGRIKVRYAGVDTGQVESTWARVVTIGGGPSRGAVFQPEVGDEVLVGFEHGDTRRPVVLGGLFSKKNTLPTGNKYVANGKVDYRRITSRENHIIEFGDGAEATAQHILLQLGTKPHKMRLGADRFDIEVGSGIPVTIKAGAAMFDINAAGNITIEGKNVTIKADGNLLLQGGQKAQLESNVQTAVQGMQVQVKASGTGSVEASGPLTVKGATVAIN